MIKGSNLYLSIFFNKEVVMPKGKGSPRPTGGNKGSDQFFKDSTQKRAEGIGKKFKVKRNPSS